MPAPHDPYDAYRPLLSGCACGRHASASDHAREQDREDAISTLKSRADDDESYLTRYVEAAMVKALFPQDSVRRKFLQAVGAGTAISAIQAVLPIGAMQAMAQEPAALEKKDLKIGFIPITCATPLIMAHPLGFYRKNGLNVDVVKTAGWALIRDKMLNREYDATQMLSPMPLAISMGAGSTAEPMRVATIQNVNGQAITLAMKHKENRDPKNWKGFKFAVPFEYSMHNFLLRYYVAEHGLDPDRDIQIRVVPPAEMVANLRAGNIDGYLAPDPFNQRAVYDEVGFIHLLTRDLWEGHPCCTFATSEAFIKQHPNTFAALFRSVLTAAAMAEKPENRGLIAKVISPQAYLNQPEAVVTQVLTGRFADGLGKIQTVPQRIDFNPVPWQSMAVWIMTQMKRWGYVKGEIQYKQLAEQVFLLTDARAKMKELGMEAPAGNAYPKFKIMNKEFDPARPDAYVDSFAIRKTT
jgi:nitrate/nitrite transport system substrate-binding protein